VAEHPLLEVVARNDLPRVEARLFGAFTLHREGQLVDAGGRKADRAREVFAVLVLHPNGLPDREIAELLWPDMAPQRAIHNLHMAVYLLRRLMGGKPAVRYATGTYQLAPQLELWTDVRDFDSLLAQARRVAVDRAPALLARAVELYRGPLLADAGWGWVEPIRMTYQSRFVAAALWLADLLAPREAAKDASQSDALAEQVLAYEPDNEAAYARLIRNCQVRRDPLGVRRIVHRYQQAASRFGFPEDPSLVRAAL
jgi:DNA-binding SARP family transcriptional activator